MSDISEDGSNKEDPTYKPEEIIKEKEKEVTEFSESSESPKQQVSRRYQKRKRDKEIKKEQVKKSKVRREIPLKKAKARQAKHGCEKSDVGIVDLDAELEEATTRVDEAGESSKQVRAPRKSQTDVASKEVNVASGSSKKGGGPVKSTKGLASCTTTPKSKTSKPLMQKKLSNYMTRTVDPDEPDVIVPDVFSDTSETDISSIASQSTTKEKKKKKRTPKGKKSDMWNHVYEKKGDCENLWCRHCTTSWAVSGLQGSTSTPLRHVRNKHYGKLSAQERENAERGKIGESTGRNISGEHLPFRSLSRSFKPDRLWPRRKCVIPDRLLGKFIVTSSTSLTILDNREFGDYSKSLNVFYRIPSRSYMQDNVITPMYEDTKNHVKSVIDNCTDLALTVDAWTSLNQKSFITLSCHVIEEVDDTWKLQAYCLDTSEMKKKHTAENILTFLNHQLSMYNLTNNTKLININSNNAKNIDDEIDDGDGVNHLLEVEDDDDQLKGHLDAELTMRQEELSQAPATDALSQYMEESTEITQCPLETEYGQSLSQPLSQLELGLYNPSTAQTDFSQYSQPQLSFVSDNGTDFHKALNKLGGFRWFGCAAHNLNLVAQAAFKKVLSAAKLVKRVKKLVEHVRRSSTTSYLLEEYQKLLDETPYRLIQENQTRWWSIMLMFESVLKNCEPLKRALGNKTQAFLLPSDKEIEAMEAIVKLLKPFKRYGDTLGSEKIVTCSLIIPLFEALKGTLAPDSEDLAVIADMKKVMLAKFTTRYTQKQLQILAVCTLLDVRYKSHSSMADHSDLGLTLIKSLMRQVSVQKGTQEEVIPPTQGQDQESLSRIVRPSSRSKKESFSHLDLLEPDSPMQEEPPIMDVEDEIKKYIKFGFPDLKQKKIVDPLAWWSDKQHEYPNLYYVAKKYLAIPATSVPSERIFSLAGFIVRKNRTNLLPDHVNQNIFLAKNKQHIPANTTVLCNDLEEEDESE